VIENGRHGLNRARILGIGRGRVFRVMVCAPSPRRHLSLIDERRFLTSSSIPCVRCAFERETRFYPLAVYGIGAVTVGAVTGCYPPEDYAQQVIAETYLARRLPKDIQRVMAEARMSAPRWFVSYICAMCRRRRERRIDANLLQASLSAAA
jgi:hypothetical protein